MNHPELVHKHPALDREGSVQSNHPELMGQNSTHLADSKVCRVLPHEFGPVLHHQHFLSARKIFHALCFSPLPPPARRASAAAQLELARSCHIFRHVDGRDVGQTLPEWLGQILPSSRSAPLCLTEREWERERR